MDFTFIVNENMLVYSALLGNKSINFIARDLKNKLYEKYPLPYKLRSDSRQLFATDNIKHKFCDLSTQMTQLFNEFKQSTEYQNLLIEAHEYRKKLENEWNEKKENIIRHTQEILKIDLPEETATVYVIPPRIGGGAYLGDLKIFWGHDEDWSNYSMVYLVHEYLHSFLPLDEKTHAMIELAIDNELRIRLNGEGEYFKADRHEIGHKNLRELEEKLLPQWKDYLQSEENIYEFAKKIRVRQ